MDAQLTCLVTIHGIGFQQPPNGRPGFADGLHANLSKYLGPLLADDPNRSRSRAGENGPVYVQSSWPPWTNRSEPGLARLGSWDPATPRTINASQAPLADRARGIAHVALVYSHLEEDAPRPGSAIEAASRAAVSFGNYASVLGGTRTILSDAWAMLEHRGTGNDGPSSSSLLIRTDGIRERTHLLPGIIRPHGSSDPVQTGAGLFATIRQLEDDVAAYVCRNDLRERVRGFVREALIRLAFRDDVTQIVVNSHSHGTVVAFDVLRQLPPSVVPKMAAFITAGSPLRKYSDLFCWGTEIGAIKELRWFNYWDPKDPVADPLSPAPDWQPGSDPSTAGVGMYKALDPMTGDLVSAVIADCQVDNLQNSGGGGLQAHNYWDNDKEVVKPLADILSGLASAPAKVPIAATAAPALP